MKIPDFKHMLMFIIIFIIQSLSHFHRCIYHLPADIIMYYTRNTTLLTFIT